MPVQILILLVSPCIWIHCWILGILTVVTIQSPTPWEILKPEVFPLLSHWMPHLHRVSKWNLVLISESELLDWFPQLLKCSVLFWKWIMLQNSNELGLWLLFWVSNACLMLLVMSHTLLSIQRSLIPSVVLRADVRWQQWTIVNGGIGLEILGQCFNIVN